MAHSAQPTQPTRNRPLLSIEGLSKHFPVSTGLFQRDRSFVHAVDGVSFQLSRGESFGLVGESGCGKTTTGKLLIRLADPTGGRIMFDDGEEEPTDIATLNGKSLKAFRRKAQMIFQDPYESMNPRLTIFDTVSEPLRVQNIGGPPRTAGARYSNARASRVDPGANLPLQVPIRAIRRPAPARRHCESTDR